MATWKKVIVSGSHADLLTVTGSQGIMLGGTSITSTAAELNALDGITAVVGELNALDIGSTAVGTAVASKAVILDSNKDYTGIRNLTVSGELDAATGDFSGAVDIAGDLTLSAGADGALTFGAASSIKIVDNQAASLVIEQADVAYMTFKTTDSSELITANKGFNAAGAFQIGGTAVTSTAAELNLLDGVSGLVQGDLTKLAAVDSTAAELNVLDGITAVVGELNALDIGSTAVGTAVASKAVILDSNKDYTGLRNFTVSGELDAATGDFSGAVDIAGDLTLSAGGDGALVFATAGQNSIKIPDNQAAALIIEQADVAYMTFTTTNDSELIVANKGFNAAGAFQIGGTAVTSTAAELNILDGVTSTAAELNILDGVTSTAAELNIIDGDTTATDTVIADADRVVLNDNGTMVQVAMTDIATYIGAGAADDISAGDAAVSISTTSGNVVVDSNAGAVSIDGHTGVTLASSNSGDITLDSVADINLDAGGNDIKFKAGGTHVLSITNSSSDVIIKPIVDAKDLIFQQRDGTAVLTIEDNGTANIPAGKLALGGTAVTSTAAELNALDGITAVVGELNALDIGSTAVGTAVASKAVILDSNKDYTGIRNLTVSGELDAATGDFSGAVDIAGNLVVQGDLLVSGDVTEVNTANLNVEDQFILLNSGSINTDVGIIFGGTHGTVNTGKALVWDHAVNHGGGADGRLAVKTNATAANTTTAFAAGTTGYYLAGVFQGSTADAATALADHAGNIRIESNELFMYF